MVIPPLRALGLILLVVTDPGAKKDLEMKAPEEITHPPSAPGEERLTPKPTLPTSNLLAHPVTPSIPSNLPEETH